MGGGDGGGDGGGGDGGERQATLSWAYWCTAVQRRPPSELTCTARSRPSRQSSPAKPTAGGALPLHVMRSESIFVTVSGCGAKLCVPPSTSTTRQTRPSPTKPSPTTLSESWSESHAVVSPTHA